MKLKINKILTKEPRKKELETKRIRTALKKNNNM
jgi:hypothetical protein